MEPKIKEEEEEEEEERLLKLRRRREVHRKNSILVKTLSICVAPVPDHRPSLTDT